MDMERDMRRMAGEQAQRDERRQAQQAEDDAHKEAAQLALQAVFRAIGTEVTAADERLHVEDESTDPPGFTVAFHKHTESSRPSFVVASTCKARTVDIQVSDGRWQQVKGVLGSWADWTDAKTVYSGAPDASAMRPALRDAFLEWYRQAIESPDEPASPSH